MICTEDMLPSSFIMYERGFSPRRGLARVGALRELVFLVATVGPWWYRAATMVLE